MRRLLALLALLLIFPTAADQACADAFVVTRAMRAETICEFRIEEGRILTELEIGARDLPAFRNLLPEDLLAKLGIEAGPLNERLPHFFEQDWAYVADGTRLPGQVASVTARVRVVRDQITGEPLPVGEGEGEQVLFFTFEHRFEGHPKVLTLTPPLVAGGRHPAAEIGFVAWHRGVPIIDFLYMPGTVTLDVDWDDPWFSRFRARNLKRRYDAPLSVFLYANHFEVLKEIIARPKDLQAWVDLGLEGASVIPVAAQGALKEKVADFLIKRGPVLIDGQSVEPILDRIHFIRRSLRTTGVIDPPEDLPIDSAQLGIILAYPVPALPKQASLTWDLWSPRIQKVPAMATDEAGGMPSTLTPEDPTLLWQNFLTNPTIPSFVDVATPPAPRTFHLISILGAIAFVVLMLRQASRLALGLSLAVVGIGLLLPLRLSAPLALPEAAATPVVQGLLRNVYRAFDFRAESDIYDALARSVEGDLLTRTYLETKRALVLENQGGARARVQEVVVESAQTSAPEEGEGFKARCTWTVAGSVGHWGHIHQRRNRYTADVTVRPIDGTWRITGLELLNEERL